MSKKIIVYSFITVLVTATICSLFGQLLLHIVAVNHQFLWLLLASPLLLFFTKKMDQLFRIHHVGMNLLIEQSRSTPYQPFREIYFTIFLFVNTLLAHLTGMSVGREGVAVQIGGSVGHYMAKQDVSAYEKSFLIKLGMIAGFAALFQTPLAACLFIIEVVGGRHNSWRSVLELVVCILFAFISSTWSHLLGLEKFYVAVTPDIYVHTLIGYSILACCVTGLGMAFVLLQREIKKHTKQLPSLIYGLLAIVILILFITNGRYNSLGTNLIATAFTTSEIYSTDFLYKLVLTATCTAIGFKGGEITPLFAIGASFGVVFATLFSLPILACAAIGYCTMFGASTRTYIAPALLGLEVFGWQMMLLMVIPCGIIYLCNKKYSIYEAMIIN